jgi:hypothetical protein
MAMPVIGGKQATWICEFCYTLAFGDSPPASWDTVWQSSVCGDCRERVAADGGYAVVKCGAYAKGPDPRGEP